MDFNRWQLGLFISLFASLDHIWDEASTLDMYASISTHGTAVHASISACTMIMDHQTGASDLRGREAAWLQISQVRNAYQGGT